MYVYCVDCYRVIEAPYFRSVGRVCAYLYTLDDDSERPMDYETSLLPKVFPCALQSTKICNVHVSLAFNVLSCSKMLNICQHCKVSNMQVAYNEV